jgi:MFS family permease
VHSTVNVASGQGPTLPELAGLLAEDKLAQLMVVLDSTIVNIALPSAQHALGFANSDRQWVVTSYALAFGQSLADR